MLSSAVTKVQENSRQNDQNNQNDNSDCALCENQNNGGNTSKVTLAQVMIKASPALSVNSEVPLQALMVNVTNFSKGKTIEGKTIKKFSNCLSLF
jgi:hypothetical protein